MPKFDSAGVGIHYEEQGSGAPVILVHGFASSARGNWIEPEWIKFLSPTYRVIALDCRGHGQSDKPHDAAAYGSATMAGDVLRLMDHLGIGRALLMGYSMGAMLSLHLTLDHPERFRATVLGGMGGASGGMAQPGRRESIVQALLTDDPATISEEIPRTFRRFAELNRNDLKALGACMSHDRPELNPQLLGAIRVPVLVVIGTKDTLVGSADQLAAAIPGAQLVKLEGRDHINAVGDKNYKAAVGKFFAAAPA